jgi:hypothetical protein
MWRDETREPTWTWVKANVDGLLSRMRSDESSWFVRDVSSPFCDEGHRAEVDALLTERAKKIDGAQTQLARGLGEVDRCIAQVKRELPAYGRLFKGKVAAPAPR